MKTFDISEIKERIDEILELVRGREDIKITSDDEVIAHLSPTLDPEGLPDWMREKPSGDFWTEFDRLAAEIGAHWPEGVSAVDAIRDVRGEW